MSNKVLNSSQLALKISQSFNNKNSSKNLKFKIEILGNKILNSIVKLCNILPSQINIKGKTTEKLGIIGKEKANHGDCVHIGRGQVGIVTSACLSPILGKNIALCRIDVGHSEIGTDVEIGKIDGHQKRIPAKIVGFPHYDPQKTRVRS